MPIHSWKNAPSGLFHHFHQNWSVAICGALNAGRLPNGFFALVEQHAGGVIPDVLTLQRRPKPEEPRQPTGGVAVAVSASRARIVSRIPESELYAAKANRVAIRNSLGEVVSVIEIVWPGNKQSLHALRTFVAKSADFLRQGIHLLMIDLLPPSQRDPQDIHPLLWSEFSDDPFELPTEKPLTLAAYCAAFPKTAYVEPVAVGDSLPALPVFLDAETYVPAPLEETYDATWSLCPAEFREAIGTSASSA